MDTPHWEGCTFISLFGMHHGPLWACENEKLFPSVGCKNRLLWAFISALGCILDLNDYLGFQRLSWIQRVSWILTTIWISTIIWISTTRANYEPARTKNYFPRCDACWAFTPHLQQLAVEIVRTALTHDIWVLPVWPWELNCIADYYNKINDTTITQLT